MKAIIALPCLLVTSLATAATITNGGFEAPPVSNVLPTPQISYYSGTIKTFAPADVPGWSTTDTGIELWMNGQPVVPGLSAYEGTAWAEINAYVAGTLFQTIVPTAGDHISFAFAHRGRGSATVADVARAWAIDLGTDGVFGTGDDVTLMDARYSDTNAAWGYYTNNLGIASGNPLMLRFEAVSQASGDVSMGNFIDAVTFGSISAVPEPATLLLTGMGLAAAALFARRRK